MILLDDNNVDQLVEATSDVGTYYNTIRGGVNGKNIVECSLMMLLGQFRAPRYSYEAIVRWTRYTQSQVILFSDLESHRVATNDLAKLFGMQGLKPTTKPVTTLVLKDENKSGKNWPA